MPSVVSPVGPDYLELVSRLLQHQRLTDPDNVIWEAADVQWWWPRDRHDDPADARVWLDGDEPVAATVLTRWSPTRVGCSVFAAADFEPAWTFAGQRCADLAPARIELAVGETDTASAAAARRAGFAPSEEKYGVSWLDPTDRLPPRQPLADGYQILARADDRSRPHPMVGRNGVSIEDGLRECSLYDPSLDLHVLAPDGSHAGYALFWPDPVTGVGLVEPMRVEDAHGGRGIGRHLLDAGLRGLTASGCTALKVSMDLANTAAVRLYTGAGFVITRRDDTWLWEGKMVT